jgi:DNA-binding XRE family transcriptional regulator
MDSKTRRIALVTSKPELDALCQNLGYSNEILAKELGVSRATLFNWKKDTRKLPRIVSLALFALAMEPALRKLNPKSQEAPTKQYRRETYTTLNAKTRVRPKAGLVTGST